MNSYKQQDDKYYTLPEWEKEKYFYYLIRNGFGHWWPCMGMGSKNGNSYPVYIRDRNPFKTLKAAIKYVNEFEARKQARA